MEVQVGHVGRLGRFGGIGFLQVLLGVGFSAAVEAVDLVEVLLGGAIEVIAVEDRGVHDLYSLQGVVEGIAQDQSTAFLFLADLALQYAADAAGEVDQRLAGIWPGQKPRQLAGRLHAGLLVDSLQVTGNLTHGVGVQDALGIVGELVGADESLLGEEALPETRDEGRRVRLDLDRPTAVGPQAEAQPRKP